MIHLVVGRQGSGKTVFIVNKAWEAHKRGMTIYSNVHLNFPYVPLNYEDIINCKLHHGMVIIDEVHRLLPARASIQKRNRLICDGFLSMVRKKKLEVYGSTQTLRKVDVRFREEQDFIYICSKWCYLDGQWGEAIHNYNLPLDVPIMVKLKVIEGFSLQEITISFIGNPYFDMYDSEQIINIDEDKLDESMEKKKKKDVNDNN